MSTLSERFPGIVGKKVVDIQDNFELIIKEINKDCLVAVAEGANPFFLTKGDIVALNDDTHPQLQFKCED